MGRILLGVAVLAALIAAGVAMVPKNVAPVASEASLGF